MSHIRHAAPMVSGAADDARRQKYLAEILDGDDFSSRGAKAGTAVTSRGNKLPRTDNSSDGPSMLWAAPRPPAVAVVKRNGRGPGEGDIGELGVEEENVTSNQLSVEIRSKMEVAQSLGSLSNVLVQDYRQEALLSSTLSMGDALTSLLQTQTAKRLTSLGLNPPQPHSETHLSDPFASSGPLHSAPRELGAAAPPPLRDHLAQSLAAHASVNPHNPASSSGGGGNAAEWSLRGSDFPREIAAAEWARGARGHADPGVRAGANNFDGPAGGESSGGSGAWGAGSRSDGGEGWGLGGTARVRRGSVEQQLVVASDNIQQMSSWEKVIATPPVFISQKVFIKSSLKSQFPQQLSTCPLLLPI